MKCISVMSLLIFLSFSKIFVLSETAFACGCMCHKLVLERLIISSSIQKCNIFFKE